MKSRSERKKKRKKEKTFPLSRIISHLDHPEHEKHVRGESLDGDGFDGRVWGEGVDSMFFFEYFFTPPRKRKVHCFLLTLPPVTLH